jgi:hypothetical protein
MHIMPHFLNWQQGGRRSLAATSSSSMPEDTTMKITMRLREKSGD